MDGGRAAVESLDFARGQQTPCRTDQLLLKCSESMTVSGDFAMTENHLFRQIGNAPMMLSAELGWRASCLRLSYRDKRI